MAYRRIFKGWPKAGIDPELHLKRCATMQQAEDILSALKKRMPKHAFGVPSEEETWFLPTGSLLLDLSIRDGKTPSGLPGGRLTEMYGLPSAGKTALALRCCKETQKLGGMVVWLDAERGFEPSLAQVIGVDLSPEKFIYTEPYGLEHVLGRSRRSRRSYHDSPNPITVVVDSVSGLNPMAYMMDDSAVKDTPPAAATAKELHRWFRRGAFWYASGSKITLIFISHLTADPRPYGGDKTPHGSAVSFYSRLRLRMAASDLKDPEGGKRLGQWLTARIVKNKMGSNAEAEMPLLPHRVQRSHGEHLLPDSTEEAGQDRQRAGGVRGQVLLQSSVADLI